MSRAQAERMRDVNVLGWYVYEGDHPVTDRYGIHAEAQWRRVRVITRWQQLLVRPALNVRVSSSVDAAIGYVYSRTYPYGDFRDPFPYPEHRAFERVSFQQQPGNWQLKHRIRLEQRFIGLLPEPPQPEVDGWRYQNRFRYSLSVRRDLSRESYLRISMEPQIRFGIHYRGRAFDQHETGVAVGRELSSRFRMELAYVYRFGVPRTGRVYEHNHTLQLTILSDAPLRR